MIKTKVKLHVTKIIDKFHFGKLDLYNNVDCKSGAFNKLLKNTFSKNCAEYKLK